MQPAHQASLTNTAEHPGEYMLHWTSNARERIPVIEQTRPKWLLPSQTLIRVEVDRTPFGEENVLELVVSKHDTPCCLF